MIAAIAFLLGCQLVGEVLVRALGVPLPGPVAGLGLLFAFLVWNGRKNGDAQNSVPEELSRVGDALMRNLSLLFIPAATGVVQYLGLLRDYAWQISLVIAASTTLAMIVTAGTFCFVSRLRGLRQDDGLDEIGPAIDTENRP